MEARETDNHKMGCGDRRSDRALSWGSGIGGERRDFLNFYPMALRVISSDFTAPREKSTAAKKGLGVDRLGLRPRVDKSRPSAAEGSDFGFRRGMPPLKKALGEGQRREGLSKSKERK